MSDFFPEEGSERQDRVRRVPKTQQLYSARSQHDPAPEPYAKDVFSREYGQAGLYPANDDLEFTPNDAYAPQDNFSPNEAIFPHEESGYAERVEEQRPVAYYRRPMEESKPYGEKSAVQEAGKFAPPPKFSMPVFQGGEPEPSKQTDFSHANIYQPKAVTRSETERRESLAHRQDAYRVEAEREAPRRKQREKHGLRRFGIVICVLAVFGAAAYVGRDWIREQISRLTGEESATVAGRTDVSANSRRTVGYDPAPAVKLNEKAQRNIAAVSGTMEIETSAVTGSHVVARVKTGENQYDVYLFSGKDGMLLGYYEGVSESGFAPQPNESFYVEQPPYLLNRDGKPLLNTSAYEQYVGKSPVLTPFENGWAIISDAAGEEYNYINQEGKLLSTLWFARALPFYGEYTAAYVDTGNLAKPEARYSLYVLSADGNMEKWQSTADTKGLVGAAGDLALLENGELVSLKDTSQIICVADSVVAYLDCEAMVARDRATGKAGLFVKGEQHYDFAYDSIEPVACEIQWKRIEDRGFTFCAVTGAAYPQPLSHYFTLQKDGVEELVALSTRSVCPVILR